ncbi:MAG: glycoside hydrolase family 10 protein [Candidatus Omnitrophota bacterium]
MRNLRIILLLVPVLAWSIFSSPPYCISDVSSETKPRLGVWVTVFSEERVLYSKENADRLIESCKKLGIDHVYLQVYRSGKAYYELDDVKNTLKYLLAKAHKNNIKIYAWVNLLSLAKNVDADILKKLGKGALAKDQYGRTPLRKSVKDELDKYFIRENQLFLEPGNKDVRKYLTGVAEDIIKKYPDFDGLHLDYVRYPAVVPFAPGSRFTPPGISYGYEKNNIERFKEITGLDVETMEHTRENFQKWDNWRRIQVTALVRDISRQVRKLSPDLKISCTIVPSIERTYLVNFQDWTRWLREKYIDWAVVMNYTDDTNMMKLNSRAMLLPQFEGKVYIGIGAFLVKDKLETLEEQISFLREIRPGGIVIFSYDDIIQSPELQEYLPLYAAGS